MKSRVCKELCLGTLDITQRKIEYYRKIAAMDFLMNKEHTQSDLPQKKQRYISETIPTHSLEYHRIAVEILQKKNS